MWSNHIADRIAVLHKEQCLGIGKWFCCFEKFWQVTRPASAVMVTDWEDFWHWMLKQKSGLAAKLPFSELIHHGPPAAPKSNRSFQEEVIMNKTWTRLQVAENRLRAAVISQVKARVHFYPLDTLWKPPLTVIAYNLNATLAWRCRYIFCGLVRTQIPELSPLR